MRNRKLTANILIIIFIMSILLVGCSGSSKNLMEDIQNNLYNANNSNSQSQISISSSLHSAELFPRYYLDYRHLQQLFHSFGKFVPGRCQLFPSRTCVIMIHIWRNRSMISSSRSHNDPIKGNKLFHREV